MADRNLEPFPRDTLVGGAGVTRTYWSEPMDVSEAVSVVYEVWVEGAYPGTVTFPATAHLETSATLEFGNWVSLTPGGVTPNLGEIATGEVQHPSRHLRVRVDVSADEAATVRVRLHIVRRA